LIFNVLQQFRCVCPDKGRFGGLTPRACVWREMVKQTVILPNHNGAKITEQNIKEVFGPRRRLSS
jgi:hypothetical protein